jgi:membrane fusion protein (multidrug efflux system)
MAARAAIRIGASLGFLAAIGGAGVWIFDQAMFVTTTDARVRARMVTLSAEVAGRLSDMPPNAGDHLGRGDTVARLDDRRARLALAQATLELKALDIEIAREKLNADVSRERGGQRVAGRKSGIDAAEAGIAAARAELGRAEGEFNRASALHASGLVADAAMERATSAREIARQAALRAEAGLADGRAGLGEAVAESRSADIASRTADALAMQAHALRQRIALLKLELEQHTITSPIDGVIDEVFAEAGEHVAPGSRIALMHAADALWMEAHIKETDLPRIAAGAAVEIRLDAARVACHGKVERIGEAATSEFALVPNANPAGVFTKITQRVPVRITLGADCGATRPGAMATLRIRAT